MTPALFLFLTFAPPVDSVEDDIGLLTTPDQTARVSLSLAAPPDPEVSLSTAVSLEELEVTVRGWTELGDVYGAELALTFTF
jgi:hypothetical protein